MGGGKGEEEGRREGGGTDDGRGTGEEGLRVLVLVMFRPRLLQAGQLQFLKMVIQ